ncbi:MAG: aconitase/3-isopropylmalate dehydratase large subunit family protein [Nitrososphaerales archaeon]
MSSASTILKNDGLTFAEKAISLNSDGEKIHRAGDTAVVNIDWAFAQDSSGPLAIKSFEEMGIDKLWDPSRVLLVIDHTYPAADEKVANLHSMIRKFVSKHGCRIEEGNISHQYVLENIAAPGMIIFGADSHTTQAGCIGAFATGVGSTEMAIIWASGQIWVQVPETIKIKLEGRLPKGVFARDIILHYIGEVGEDGANYKSIEWYGDTVKELTIDSRACISNASMESGCKTSVFPIDEVARRFLKEVGREPKYVIEPGDRSEYADEHMIECEKLQPVVTGPDTLETAHAVEEMSNIVIDEAFIGSSTNCRIEDLEVTARILKGRSIHSGTRCIITPASKKIYKEAIDRGYVDIFLDSGAVFTNVTCGACVGTHLGVLGDGEVAISSSSRNYVGRMGALTAKAYLASPATVAASAVEGRVADPRRYL